MSAPAHARFVAALRAAGCRGGNGAWTCPAHEDRSPSLSVGTGDDGRVLVHCFAGCETADVMAALGLTVRDLFDDRAGPAPRTRRPTRRAREPRGRIGMPTWDDRFWGQPAEVVDAHFAALGPGPSDDEVAAPIAQLRTGEVPRV